MSCGAQGVGAQLGHAWDPMWMDAAFLGRLFSWGLPSHWGSSSPQEENLPALGIWAPALTSLLSRPLQEQGGSRSGREDGAGWVGEAVVYVCVLGGGFGKTHG